MTLPAGILIWAGCWDAVRGVLVGGWPPLIDGSTAPMARFTVEAILPPIALRQGGKHHTIKGSLSASGSNRDSSEELQT